MLGHPHLLLYRHHRGLPRRGTRAMAGGCAMIARRESLLAPMPRTLRPDGLPVPNPMFPCLRSLLAPTLYIEHSEFFVVQVGLIIVCSAIKGRLVLDIVSVL